MLTEPKTLLAPFRRDAKRDFASGSGEQLLASKVIQALLTEGTTPRSSGELPWRTRFGSGLHVLRHLRNDAALADLARIHVRDCLKRWVPEVELVEVSAKNDGATLRLTVRVSTSGRSGGAAAVAQVELTLDYSMKPA